MVHKVRRLRHSKIGGKIHIPRTREARVTVLSNRLCAKHNCRCIERGEMIVCLKCEEEEAHAKFPREHGHVDPRVIAAGKTP